MYVFIRSGTGSIKLLRILDVIDTVSVSIEIEMVYTYNEEVRKYSFNNN